MLRNTACDMLKLFRNDFNSVSSNCVESVPRAVASVACGNELMTGTTLAAARGTDYWREAMSTNYENLIVEMTAPIARVMLNRPERRNALSLALMQELTACLREIGASNEIRAVILSAVG